jgi:hypothetical protein
MPETLGVQPTTTLDGAALLDAAPGIIRDPELCL